MTIYNLSNRYIKNEIRNVKQRLRLYKDLYDSDKIKCIRLKKLITIKEAELKILLLLDKEYIDNND